MTGKHAVRGLLALAIALVGARADAQPPARFDPGDLLYLEVYRVPELTTTFQVDGSGLVTLPYVGSVNLNGLNEAEAAAAISVALKPILRDPRVTVAKSPVRTSGAIVGRAPDMQMELVPLQNANAAELAASLQGTSSLGGSISFDTNTNTLIVSDTPDAIRNIMNVVARLDQMQSHLTQVRIEAHIAEVRVGALKELGVRWFVQGNEGLAGFYPLPVQDPALLSTKGGSTPFGNEQINSGDSVAGIPGTGGARRLIDNMLDRRLQVPVQIPLPGQSFFGYTNEHVDIGAMLDALVQDNDAELLANPMTYAVNHATAEIRMTDEFPYTEFGTEITGATSFSTKFLDLGIILRVTPHVYQDQGGPYVKLDVEPEVSFPVGSNGGVPIRSVRSASTIANVRDNQTLVIGGILREDERKFDSRVPGIGNLPLIGKLFSHTENTKFRSELMIFVTPKIHQRPEDITWDTMIDVSSELADRNLLPQFAQTGEARKQ